MELPGALEADAVIGTGRRRLLLGALALWAALTIFSRLGGAPVYIINEGREGVYVRAMLDTGDWILPSVPNHVECGAFHSHTVFQRLNQCSCSACSAQNASGSFAARA